MVCLTFTLRAIEDLKYGLFNRIDEIAISRETCLQRVINVLVHLFTVEHKNVFSYLYRSL